LNVFIARIGFKNLKAFDSPHQNKLWACHRYEFFKERTIPRPPAQRVNGEVTQKEAEVKRFAAFFFAYSPGL
jgi:hypothetical protein